MHRPNDAPSRTSRAARPCAVTLPTAIALLVAGAGLTAGPASAQDGGGTSVGGTTTSEAPATAGTSSAPATSDAAVRSGTVLALGSKGSRVMALQRTLWQLGLPVARDGAFGAATEVALRRFEHEEGLTVDGVADAAQLAAMQRRARPLVQERGFASRTLRVGSVGTDVRAIQRLLIDHGVRVPTHGKYTAAIRTRIRSWESSASLRADGVLSRSDAKRLRESTPAPPPADADAAAAVTAGRTTSARVGADGYTFPILGAWHWGEEGTFFGDRGGAHQGVDALADCGLPLVAASSGVVKHNEVQASAGNYLVITDTPTGEDQAYMHLQARSPLKVGAKVQAGTPIGLVGRSGNASACHLHFELWTAPGWYSGGKPRDPKPDLTRWASAAGLPAARR